MLDFLVGLTRFLHSWTRWIFLALTVVLVLYFILSLTSKREWTKQAQIMLSAFSGLVGLQWLLGLVLLVAYGIQTTFGQRHFWEHLTMQTIALVVAHLHFRWRRNPDISDQQRYQYGLVVVVLTTVIIIVGVLTLPGIIQWRFYVPGA